MAYQDYVKSCRKGAPLVLSGHPIPPMLLLHKYSYPAEHEYGYHSNAFSSACLVLKGGMVFQERGFPEFLCEAGKIALVPSGCAYRWRIDEETDTFQCLHDGFSSYEHSELSILFGMWQRRVGFAAIGVERAQEFMRQIDGLAARGAPEIRYSIATLSLLADAVESLGDRQAWRKGEECAPITKCVYFIERNLGRPISAAELAREAGVSQSRLFQLFQLNFNMPPLQYVSKRKTEEAKRLLTSSELSLGEIAERLGFNSSNYFIRFFKKHAGTTPLELRKRECVRLAGRI